MYLSHPYGHKTVLASFATNVYCRIEASSLRVFCSSLSMQMHLLVSAFSLTLEIYEDIRKLTKLFEEGKGVGGQRSSFLSLLGVQNHLLMSETDYSRLKLSLKLQLITISSSKATKISYFLPAPITSAHHNLPGWFLAERWAVYPKKKKVFELPSKELPHVSEGK